MQQLLRAFLLLTAWSLLLASPQRTYATHAQGGELTYQYLRTNPNGKQVYLVTCRYFRDCGGLIIEDELPLFCRVGSPATSCTSNDPRNPPAAIPLIKGVTTVGSPYCRSVPNANQCSPNAPTNYETARYAAEVELAPAPEWTLSVHVSARPGMENIGGGELRLEATLRNQLTPVGGGVAFTIQNSSPQYQDQDIPIPFVCNGQQTTITFSATDPADNDSLVYALDRPLNGCQQFAAYRPFSPAGLLLDPSHRLPDNPCVIVLPPDMLDYSPTFPLPSYSSAGACPTKVGAPLFAFNAQTGSMTFRPNRLNSTVNNNQSNKYAVVGKVTEYRKINGRYYLVGSVRRDMLIVVIDCGGNMLPNPPLAASTTPRGGTTLVNSLDSTFISVNTCSYSQVRVRFTDPNPGQNLTVSIPAAALAALRDSDVMPPNGFRLAGNGTAAPVVTLLFQPSAQLAGTVLRLPVRIEDDACPIKGVQNRIIVIRVVRGNFAAATVAADPPLPPGATTATICAGASVQLTSAVLRPDSVRGGLQTYVYQWDPANGLNPADRTNRVVRVRPDVTTRYRLRIMPITGYSPGLCGDTTSVVVRVVPPVTARFRVDSASVTGNGPGVVGGQFNRPPRVFSFTNLTTPAAVDSVRWTYQRVRDGAGAALTEPERTFARIGQAPPLTLATAGVYVVRLRAMNRATSADCAESVASRTVTVPQLAVPNVFTPNRDGYNDTFVVQAEQAGSKLEIFNRWGRKIREFSNYNNDWDGEGQPAGVYYYHLVTNDGQVSKGWVELVR